MIDGGIFFSLLLFYFRCGGKTLPERGGHDVTDSYSPAQSRVGEKQEISCVESEGQRKV